MKCIDATVRASGWRTYNDGRRRPIAWEPKILVDAIPERSELRYETKRQGRGAAYFAERDGYVSFFWHDPGDQSGFGGSTIRGQLTDDSEFAIKGPWSSSSASMTKLGFPATLSVSITDDPEVWERGFTFWAGSVTAEWFQTKALPHLSAFTFTPEAMPYVGDSASGEQSRFIASGLNVETVPVFVLQPRHLVFCDGCDGRGFIVLDEPCRHSICRGGLVWPGTPSEKPCGSCGGDGKARTLCRVCDGYGVDVAATSLTGEGVR